MNNFLHEAYLATSYHVQYEAGTFKLTLDAIHPEFNAWCHAQHIDRWAFITAYNPLSEALSVAENASRNGQLQALLEAEGFVFQHGQGVPATNDWLPEDSFFIRNIALVRARELGKLFGQNALVFGEVDHLPQLLWL